MRHPNGYGSVSKMSGKRRRPYMVQITTGYTVDPVLGTAKQLRQVLGYYAKREDALQALADYNKDPYSLETARVTFAELYDIVKKKRFYTRQIPQLPERIPVPRSGRRSPDTVDPCRTDAGLYRCLPDDPAARD